MSAENKKSLGLLDWIYSEGGNDGTNHQEVLFIICMKASSEKKIEYLDDSFQYLENAFAKYPALSSNVCLEHVLNRILSSKPSQSETPYIEEVIIFLVKKWLDNHKELVDKFEQPLEDSGENIMPDLLRRYKIKSSFRNFSFPDFQTRINEVFSKIPANDYPARKLYVCGTMKCFIDCASIEKPLRMEILKWLIQEILPKAEPKNQENLESKNSLASAAVAVRRQESEHPLHAPSPQPALQIPVVQQSPNESQEKDELQKSWCPLL